MLKKTALAIALAAASWSGTALAGEALLIRHEVLTVPVGTEIELRPGFFIGKAWMADPTVANAGIDAGLREVTLRAQAPGRTVVSTWNLREPAKRIEYEIVVVANGDWANTPEFPAEPTNITPETSSTSVTPETISTSVPETVETTESTPVATP